MRISSLPRFLECPSSALPCEHPYEPTNQAAAEGSAVHKCLQLWLEERDFDLAGVAARYGADIEEVEFLFEQGRRAWLAGLSVLAPNPSCEVRLDDHPDVQGTADVFYRSDEHLVVADWKSNRVLRSYDAQLAGYALAVVERYGMPDCGYVTTAIIWLRYGEAEVKRYDKLELLGFEDQIRRAKTEIGKRYSPGEACAFCPRRLICDARKQLVGFATSALLTAARSYPDEEVSVGNTYPLVKVLRAALDDYDRALRDALSDGPLETGDGYRLELYEQGRDQILPDRAWETLQAQGYTQEDLAACVKMSKTQVLAITNERAKRGQKSKAKAALMEQLHAAGAIKRTSILAVKRSKAT